MLKCHNYKDNILICNCLKDPMTIMILKQEKQQQQWFFVTCLICKSLIYMENCFPIKPKYILF